MQVMPLGSMQARLAAMERGDLDAMVIEFATGFELEELKRGRIIIDFGDIEKHFYTHVIFATDAHGRKRTDALRRFLRGWFKTIAFIRANKDDDREDHLEGDQRARKHRDARSTMRRSTASRRDGAWNPVAIEVIRRSLKDLGILDCCRTRGRSTTTSSCR